MYLFIFCFWPIRNLYIHISCPSFCLLLLAIHSTENKSVSCFSSFVTQLSFACAGGSTCCYFFSSLIQRPSYGINNISFSSFTIFFCSSCLHVFIHGVHYSKKIWNIVYNDHKKPWSSALVMPNKELCYNNNGHTQQLYDETKREIVV